MENDPCSRIKEKFLSCTREECDLSDCEMWRSALLQCKENEKVNKNESWKHHNRCRMF